MRELTDIVIFDSEMQSEATPNKSEYYHIIGQRFSIAKEDYIELLPKSAAGVSVPIGPSFFDKGSSMPTTTHYPSSSQT